ncbi:hypothetical protein HZ326_3794 [Fusarium oxysporum f. sp. albedinis]|nr:hypothetical protein HZ326_3794 [Fusarium oxysporum f. sp. albedinis]
MEPPLTTLNFKGLPLSNGAYFRFICFVMRPSAGFNNLVPFALFDRHWDESNSGPRCCTNYDYLHVGNRKVRMKLRQPVHRYQPWENIIIKLD